jgi:TPR repeat protein
VRWYRLAAEQGNASAQSNLGFMYTKGEGVRKDDAEAVRWYRLAAEQGYADAQYNLAAMYRKGDGVLKDAALAHMWYNISSANGKVAAGELRDFIEKNMTREQIAEATQLARSCMESNYQDCE